MCLRINVVHLEFLDSDLEVARYPPENPGLDSGSCTTTIWNSWTFFFFIYIVYPFLYASALQPSTSWWLGFLLSSLISRWGVTSFPCRLHELQKLVLYSSSLIFQVGIVAPRTLNVAPAKGHFYCPRQKYLCLLTFF